DEGRRRLVGGGDLVGGLALAKDRRVDLARLAVRGIGRGAHVLGHAGDSRQMATSSFHPDASWCTSWVISIWRGKVAAMPIRMAASVLSRAAIMIITAKMTASARMPPVALIPSRTITALICARSASRKRDLKPASQRRRL